MRSTVEVDEAKITEGRKEGREEEENEDEGGRDEEGEMFNFPVVVVALALFR